MTIIAGYAVGFFGLLLILKLAHLVPWSWGWITLPLWLPLLPHTIWCLYGLLCLAWDTWRARHHG